MKYNLSKIMLKAWKVYRKTKNISFAEALHRAWLSAKAEEINAKRIEDAKHAAGITEETNTFAKWKELGYKVKPPFLPLATIYGTSACMISSFDCTTFTKPTGTPIMSSGFSLPSSISS